MKTSFIAQCGGAVYVLHIVNHQAPNLCTLIGDLTKFKTNPIVIKEGTKYKLKIEFRVSWEQCT